MIVVKVPGINGLNKTAGCRNAGNSILKSLNDIWTNESGKEIDISEISLEEIHVDNENLEEQEKLIYENARDVIEMQDKVLFLGGDHSISYSIGKAFLDYCKEKDKEGCLIVFDAHADCMKPGKNPNHEEWLRGLVEEGFNPKNILLVGSRNNDVEENEFLKEKKISRVSVNDINNNIEEAADIITEFASGKELYVSFDIDVIDPVFAPATGYKEPGGLTSRQGIYLLSRISKMKNLKVFDLVEVNSEEDEKHGNLTTKLAAKLLAELL